LGDYLFYYTKHALEKMDALGILKSEVESAMRRGMKWKEEKSEKWHAQMGGIEIVFMKQENNFVIITIYLARREK